MVATGVFVASTDGVLTSVRNTTVLVVTSLDPAMQEVLQFEVLQGMDSAAEPNEAGDDDEIMDTKQATQPVSRTNRITAVELFCPQPSHRIALLLLVDERRLVHYELDVVAKTLVLKTSRSVPRSATCMTVGQLTLPSGHIHHVVIIGQKTGEVVAVPFPDVDRDLKTLLGHTTSMITDVAVNHDSSLLLTADRNEKVRVSRFPEASTIESYCLGHAASLIKIACSTVTPELGVSTSMDNTIKLWQIKTGKLVASVALLPHVDVSFQPLDEASKKDDSGAKSLIFHVSLAISPTTNLLCVLVNYQVVRFFEIVAASETYTLKELVLPTEDVQSLLVNEPCELRFTEHGVLVVSYKQFPFLQLFAICKSEVGHKLLQVDAAASVLSNFRAAAAKIALVDEEEHTRVVPEGGLKKKKARIREGDQKVLGAI